MGTSGSKAIVVGQQAEFTLSERHLENDIFQRSTSPQQAERACDSRLVGHRGYWS